MTKRDRRNDEPDGEHAGPEEPASWRDVIRSDYRYPEELDTLDRRSRRRAKKAWRRDDYAQRNAWLRRQRQTEPSSPIAIVAAVLLLALVVLGLGGGLPRLLGTDEPARGEVGLLTPSAPGVIPQTTIASPSPGVTTGSPSSTVPSPVTERPSSAALAAATEVSRNWARAFYTRNPAAETYSDLVTRASKFTTTEVSDSLREAGDSTYEALKVNQGTSRVISADVQPPKADSAPVDTPTRVSRLVTVTIEVSGKKPDRILLPLLLTLAADDGGWVISDIDGSAGP